MAGFDASAACLRYRATVSRLMPAQLARDLTLGQALAVQRTDEIYHGHFEQIRHDAAPEKGRYPWSLSVESARPQIKAAGFQLSNAPIAGWFSSAR
jgi:hypothetical protein